MSAEFEKWWREEGKRIPSMDGSEVAVKIIAAHAYQAAMPKWLPIERAPKDERVLIYGELHEILTWTNHSDEDEWPEGTSHWQPLPEPPES